MYKIIAPGSTIQTIRPRSFPRSTGTGRRGALSLMPKTLLGIIASPRKFGNSEIFVKELFHGLEGAWDLKLLRLQDFDLRPCRACYECLFGEMKCPVDDDFSVVLEAMVRADALAVVSPAYLLAANGSLKKFLDRGLAFYGRAEQLWGKPAVGVAIAGIEGKEGATKLNVESFIKLTFGDLRGTEVVYGAMPGEIFLDGRGREAARWLAGALSDPAQRIAPGVPVCPACGGDTFRFLPEGGVRCMLCSNTGRIECEDGKFEISMFRDEHPLFLTLEDVLRHAEWLRGMKEKFMERRKELRAVTREYTGVGHWIVPEKRQRREE